MAMLDAEPQPTERERIAKLEEQVALLTEFAKAVIAKTEGTDGVVKALGQMARLKDGVMPLTLTLGERLREQFPKL